MPRVYEQFSTRRVLTMQFLKGTHVDQFVAGGPSQEERDHFGTLILRATSRLHYTGKMLYADPSTGNFLFLPDGRLGLIDFGCVRHYNDAEWHCNLLADQCIQEGPDFNVAAVREFAGLAEGEQAPPEHLELLRSWCHWTWRPYWHDGPFDFGDGLTCAKGVDLLSPILQRAILARRRHGRLHHALVPGRQGDALPPARPGRRERNLPAKAHRDRMERRP